MSEYVPQVGDRVRVVMEAPIVVLGSAGFCVGRSMSDCAEVFDEFVISVEKIADPLPTTPGSVIHERNGIYLHRSGEGKWVSDGGTQYEEADFSETSHFEVIFDAGADR